MSKKMYVFFTVSGIGASPFLPKSTLFNSSIKYEGYHIVNGYHRSVSQNQCPFKLIYLFGGACDGHIAVNASQSDCAPWACLLGRFGMGVINGGKPPMTLQGSAAFLFVRPEVSYGNLRLFLDMLLKPLQFPVNDCLFILGQTQLFLRQPYG